ncbi:MAG TPA: hypothetical protein VHM70_30845 [Polyangiaceae bacterium]|nr:hypothetical protein [Polyangiaceae bacterium]
MSLSTLRRPLTIATRSCTAALIALALAACSDDSSSSDDTLTTTSDTADASDTETETTPTTPTTTPTETDQSDAGGPTTSTSEPDAAVTPPPDSGTPDEPDAASSDSGAPSADAGAGDAGGHADGGSDTGSDAGQVDAGPSAGDSGGGVTFPQVQEFVFAGCGGGHGGIPGPLASCHSGENAADGLDLLGPDAFDLLVNGQSMLYPDQTLVIPGDPDHSFLMRKLLNDLPEDMSLGDPMPKGEAIRWQQLPDDQINLVRDWIAGGAKP